MFARIAFVFFVLFSENYADFIDKGFERGRELLESDKWKLIEEGLWTHTFKEYSEWPYFMYSICTKVPIESYGRKRCNALLDIEVYNYQDCSKHWIPQLVQGKRVAPKTQYLEYNFFPFQNRDVCQTYHIRNSNLYTSLSSNRGANCQISSSLSVTESLMIQAFIHSSQELDDTYLCRNKTSEISSKKEKLWMYEDVHKFFYPDETSEGEPCNRMIYIGVEDPKGKLFHLRWLLKYVYSYFYQSHFSAYKRFLREIQN